MEALKGVRVSGIPDQTSGLHLQQYFSDSSLSGGGPVAEILFPMLANEAVIFFHSQTDATSVLSRNHDVFKVKPLPHQVFACVTAVLDEGMAALVVSSKEHQRCLREGGLKLSMSGEELLVEGSPYQLEFAWTYLHGVMDKQCLIQDHLLGRGSGLASVAPLDLGQNQVSSTSSSAASTPRHSRPPSGRRKQDASKNSATALVNGHEDSDQQSPRATSSSRSLHKTSNASSKSSSAAARPTTVESPSPRLSSQQPQPASRDIQRRDVSLSLSPEHSPETMPKSLVPSEILPQPSTSSGLTDTLRPQPAPRTTVADRLAQPSYLSGLEDLGLDDPTSMISDEGHPVRRHDAEQTFNHFLSMPEQGISWEEDRATANHVRSRATQDLAPGATGGSLSSLSGSTSMLAAVGAEAAGDSRQSSQASAARDKLTFEVGSGVKVKVYEGDITKVRTEGVVNAANSELRNWSGVAGALLKAAGPKLKRECEDYIIRHGYLNTTEVTHTGAGDMRNVLYIIHTVGPFFLPGKEEACLCELQKTYYNCLTYANTKVLRSISFPYISTGVFGVPLEICVEAFLGGVLLFGMDLAEKDLRLKSIELVHNDRSVVCQAVALLQKLLEGGQDAVLAQALSRANTDVPSPRDYRSLVDVESPRERDYRERDYSSLTALDRKRSSSFSHGSKKKSSTDLDYKNLGATAGSRVRGEEVRSEGHISDTTPTPSPRTRSSSLDRRRPASETGARAKASSSSSSSTATRTSSGLPGGYSSTKYLGSTTDFSMKGTGPGKKSSSSGASSSGHRPQPMKAFAGSAESESSPLSKTSYLDKYDKYATDKYTTDLTRSRRTNDDDDLMMRSLPADPSKLRRRLYDQCPICLDDMITSKKLQCGHEFCRKCIDQAFKMKPVCPTCNKVFGPLKGDQPRGGRMIDTIDSRTILPGHETAPGAIVIRYTFPSGIQEKHHPSPGRPYVGIDRTAYLPNSTEGREVLRLLKKAFDAGLVFTISDSRTTGAEGVITWAEIHHKTRTFGGSANHGYPDSTYLKRVKEELALKGITS